MSKARAAKAPDREQIRQNMQKMLGKLADYYGDDAAGLAKEVEQVRRGDPGANGDLSVIIWAGGQLAMYKTIAEQDDNES